MSIPSINKKINKVCPWGSYSSFNFNSSLLWWTSTITLSVSKYLCTWLYILFLLLIEESTGVYSDPLISVLTCVCMVCVAGEKDTGFEVSPEEVQHTAVRLDEQADAIPTSSSSDSLSLSDEPDARASLPTPSDILVSYSTFPGVFACLFMS